jgi:hypothetical protein
VWKAKTLVALALLGTSGCREADLGPLRADLASNAEIVCAPPPARPPPGPKTRDVQPAEVAAALMTLCEQHSAQQAATPEALAVLHEALAQDRPIAGELRRNTMMLGPPRPDGASSGCTPSWQQIDRLMLASASATYRASGAAAAFVRCVDVVALARDVALTGNVLDLLLANAHIQQAVEVCRPMVDTAPKEAAAKLARELTTLRTTFPATLDAVLRRDRAETVLFLFGKGRDPSRPLPCARAGALAAASDGKPLTRGDRVDLDHAWREARARNVAPDPTIEEAYRLTLVVLDQLIEQASSR